MTGDFIDDAAGIMRQSGNEFLIVERSRDGKEFAVRMLCGSYASAEELAGKALEAARVVHEAEGFSGAAGDGGDGAGAGGGPAPGE